MYNKNGIVNKIYTSGILDTLFKNMGVKDNDKEDLKQEIAIILLDYNEDKLIAMYEKKQIKFFLIRIIQNQYFSANSPYYKKYKKYYTLIDGNIINGEMENEENEDNGGNE